MPSRRRVSKMSEELSKRDGPKSGDFGQIDEENISEDGESANHTRFSDKQNILSEELIQDQLRMSDLEFGRLSGGLVHSRSENDAEWERTDVLSEQREIGVKLEMENERWLERTNRSDLEHTETSFSTLDTTSLTTLGCPRLTLPTILPPLSHRPPLSSAANHRLFTFRFSLHLASSTLTRTSHSFSFPTQV
ncbi:hypothetical protein BLNAU_24907 [Blattamonas nauphoetae]|uniref:Uncharacterized protein n=1 Tax=Blattamonas nauphoetae TaxID=2049346 RepID=A0ABQ9WL57_9EUKA|nr:hypothetical protein BLNAU_24907 [Blattamonas nauphoetae]